MDVKGLRSDQKNLLEFIEEMNNVPMEVNVELPFGMLLALLIEGGYGRSLAISLESKDCVLSLLSVLMKVDFRESLEEDEIRKLDKLFDKIGKMTVSNKEYIERKGFLEK